MLLACWKRKFYPTNLLFLAGLNLLEAYTVSVDVTFYKFSIVLNDVLLAAFACQTKYDFTSWLPYLFCFVSRLLPYSSTAELVYDGLAARVFSGCKLVDTQLVTRYSHVEAIATAIGLFFAILRILDSQQQN